MEISELSRRLSYQLVNFNSILISPFYQQSMMWAPLQTERMFWEIAYRLEFCSPVVPWHFRHPVRVSMCKVKVFQS